MNYLSFDVGIKNLAYCILSKEKVIIDWGIINLNENPICQVHLKKPCEKQSTYIVKDGGDIEYCCTAHSKKFKKLKKINVNHDLNKISEICITKLRKLNLQDVNTVLIENQPALKNPVMKSIQMIIYTYFMIEGIMNKESLIKNIHMVNARNKLKVYKGPKIECNKKGKYAQNKFLGIEYTKIMIENDNDHFKHLFNQSKKKDDLADSYLQGIYWIEK